MFVLMLGIGMHVVQKRTLSFKELGTGGDIWNFGIHSFCPPHGRLGTGGDTWNFGIHRFSKVGYIRSLIWKWPTKLCTFCRSFSEISLPVPNWALISEIHGFQISLSFRLYPTSRKSKVPFFEIMTSVPNCLRRHWIPTYRTKKAGTHTDPGTKISSQTKNHTDYFYKKLSPQ